MSGKSYKHGDSKSKKQDAGSFDIRDMIRRAQHGKREQQQERIEEVEEVEKVSNAEDADGDKLMKDEEEEEANYLKELLKDDPIGELNEQESTSDSVPLPKRKTEYERYLKSKEREEQVCVSSK